MSVLLPDNGGTKEYGERLSRAGQDPRSADEERRRRTRRRRTWIAMGVILTVGVAAILSALATFPVSTRPYSVNVVTEPTPIATTFRPDTVTPDDSGIAFFEVPDGAAVSGTWAVQNRTDVEVIVQYGTAGYTNVSAANGSFSLSGSSPVFLGGSTYVALEVISPFPVLVEFKGTYTAPVI